MNSVVITVLISLLVLCAQGQQDTSSKCKCSKDFVGRINSRQIKGEPLVLPPSIFCPHTEIIITTTADKEKCVNPKSQFGQLILKNKDKQEKNGAGSKTTTTTTTTTMMAASSQ
ncbi:C-X-C motif chemokine 10-like [Plectropomus leopardus]|uniref:C-X-C motif chemokine 10-like n=1 Tax=Plectropomus leopardus TaxID=160734 RepID=UPI001C4CA8A8|nr:C-X-C motif chemokine 10-like [Plectropomus leopardus]